MLHIRAAGRRPSPSSCDRAEALDCHAYDTAAGNVLRPGGPNGWQTFQAFQAYRDRVLGLLDPSVTDTSRLPGRAHFTCRKFAGGKGGGPGYSRA
jgi:hypothetical protein